MTKIYLDRLATLLGLISGITIVLSTNDMIDRKIGGTISGVCTVITGYIIQSPAKED